MVLALVNGPTVMTWIGDFDAAELPDGDEPPDEGELLPHAASMADATNATGVMYISLRFIAIMSSLWFRFSECW
jgi:hypothetical protein